MGKTQTPPPKRKRAAGTKGEPPPEVAAPGNLERPGYSGEMKNLNFTVPAEFRREFKAYAALLGRSMVDVLYEAYDLHRQKYGS